MGQMAASETQLAPYLEKIRALEFVKALDFSAEPNSHEDKGIDGKLRIRTPKGTFNFLVEQKSSYLDRSLLSAFIAQAKYQAEAHRRPVILFARYVPRPSAERLVASGINFLDRVGNIHLTLGSNYSHTVLGNREPQAFRESASPGAARIQLLFTFAADPQTGESTVRELAEASGLSKSSVARLREELVKDQILKHTSHGYEVRDKKELHQILLAGYDNTLRPKLFINRFRAPESDPEQLLPRLKASLSPLAMKWSLTGAAAAYHLQHYYKAPEVPLFVETSSDETFRKLRLLPDRNGPITLLRSFGVLPFWKEISGLTIAHPWLIYAELMRSRDSRAHEAAEQLRAEFIHD
jgi:hypothetical protein